MRHPLWTVDPLDPLSISKARNQLKSSLEQKHLARAVPMEGAINS